MTKNLLALLLALQKATLDTDTQNHLLPQLGNKLEAFSKKYPNAQDWHSVQAKINSILNKNPSLAERYQQIFTCLQSWTDDQLRALLPTAEQLKSLQPQSIPTLGYPPAPFPPYPDELENLIVDVSKIILRHKDLVKTIQKLLPNANEVVVKQPDTDKKC